MKWGENIQGDLQACDLTPTLIKGRIPSHAKRRIGYVVLVIPGHPSDVDIGVGHPVIYIRNQDLGIQGKPIAVPFLSKCCKL